MPKTSATSPLVRAQGAVLLAVLAAYVPSYAGNIRAKTTENYGYGSVVSTYPSVP